MADEVVMKQQTRARHLTQRLNTINRADFEGVQKVAAELLGADDCWMNPPFYRDYGFDRSVRRNFYADSEAFAEMWRIWNEKG